MWFWQAFRRLRHSKGFGVHSPSAYQFITDVIHPLPYYTYYAYPTLPKTYCNISAELIFRTVAFLTPSTVEIAGSDISQVKKVATIVHAAHPVKIISEGEADMMICLDSVSTVKSRWKHAMINNLEHPVMDDIKKASTGHIFMSRKAAIFINTRVPHQIFDVSF